MTHPPWFLALADCNGGQQARFFSWLWFDNGDLHVAITGDKRTTRHRGEGTRPISLHTSGWPPVATPAFAAVALDGLGTVGVARRRTPRRKFPFDSTVARATRRSLPVSR